MNLLEEIVAYKKFEIEQAKSILSKQDLKQKAKKIKRKRIFLKNILESVLKKKISVIAEIKKASPSKGIICKDFNPVFVAKEYEKGGAICLSVLTDKKFFQGDLKYIIDVKKEVHLPILRKDFILDMYQIYESVYHQADCILLIAGILKKEEIKNYAYLALEYEMDFIVEVHNEREMEKTLSAFEDYKEPFLLGINNRDLKTFKTSIEVTKNLVKKYKRDLKNKIIVSESGIESKNDINSLIKESNVYAFLIGESLMREKEISKVLRTLTTSSL